MFPNIRGTKNLKYSRSSRLIPHRRKEHLESPFSCDTTIWTSMSSCIQPPSPPCKRHAEEPSTTTDDQCPPISNRAGEDCYFSPTVDGLQKLESPLWPESTTETEIRNRRLPICRSSTTGCNYVRNCNWNGISPILHVVTTNVQTIHSNQCSFVY